MNVARWDLGLPLWAAIDSTPAGPLLAVALPTVIFLLVAAAVWWGRNRVLAWINRRMAGQVRRLESAHLRRVSLKQLLGLSQLLVRIATTIVLLAVTALWLTAVLDALPATHGWAVRIERALMDQLSTLAQGTLAAVPGLGVVVVLFFVTRVIHEMVTHYFHLIEYGEVESEVWDGVTAQTTRRLATVVLWTGAVIVAYPYIPGSETPAFKGIGILAGVMLSLGSTNLVGHLISGLVLIYNRTIRPGDFIATPEAEGVVVQIGLFSSAIRTVDEIVITLPNSKLAEHVRNHSRPSEGAAVRHTATVTIGYDTPWKQVYDLLLAAAGDVADVRQEPAPYVRQVGLDDFYVRYELVYAPADPRRRKRILSDVHEAIQNRFHAAGVQIMSPHYLGDPPHAKVPPAP